MHKIPTQGRTSHCTILPERSFSINYNKTHKSQIKYEIKYDLYKISPKNKKN